jgi:tetratricopeptide (TPR) repeat protein
MSSTSVIAAPPEPSPHPASADGAPKLRRRFDSPKLFWPALLALVTVGLLRSWIVTGKDGLQIDEAWHAVAGISYARTGDFRLNPEHPPLVKLWVGITMPEATFRLPAFRPLEDKEGERVFIDDAFYLDNDPRAVQEQCRRSMLAFHGLVLLALGWALKRTFGGPVALVSVALLLLDPTVAAHLPVVLTDLPLTLLSALAVLLAFTAFRSFRPADLAFAALGLGLALVSKHSAIPVGLFVVGYGLLRAVLPLDSAARANAPLPRVRLLRVLAVLAVGLGAYLTLWAFYGFRFAESPLPAGGVAFNRPIEDKISDLQSGGYRSILQLALDLHALPRAYLWGLADIIRAGVEGRQDVMYVFGHVVFGNTPWYFFPAVLLAKLPLALLALSTSGAVLLVRRGLPQAFRAPTLVLLAWAGFYLIFIIRGNSGYAGIRHAAPVYPALALLAGLAVVASWNLTYPAAARAATALACLLLVGTALPVMRPWEYYNELAGGSEDAWRYFADDGLENGQRVKDIAAYYDAHLRGTSEHAYDFYDLFDNEKKAYDLHFRELADDPNDTDVIEGTVFVNTRWLGERPLYDYGAFRAAKPVARFGNLLVLRGRFQIPWLRADRRLAAVHEALSADQRDPARAEQLLSEVTDIYPQDYQASFELGNLLVERGERHHAIRAYSLAREHAPKGDAIVEVLSRQIDALASAATDVAPLRNPWLE